MLLRRSRGVSLKLRSSARLWALGLAAWSAAAGAALVPAPQGADFPGEIVLSVDVTDLAHRVIDVHQTLPVTPGTLKLYYPQWLPGNHAPRGPIDAVAGLSIQAGDQALPWLRDPLDVYAFSVVVPQGVSSLDIRFQYASPLSSDQGRVVVTPEIVNLQWNAVLLYPAGYDARQIRFSPRLKLPEGWGYGTALRAQAGEGDSVRFGSETLETLVDSPVFAGKYFKRYDLAPGAKIPVALNVVGDTAEAVEAKPEQLEAHRKLVAEALKTFGSQHYDHYDFLLATSENLSGIGLEHHRSSENGVGADYFTDWSKTAARRSLLPHEFTHSWNGKFRRPADLWTPHFNTPMQDSGLWVYEGQTQFWGTILSARSGLWTPEYTRDAIAAVAATYDRGRPGNAWRPLIDTTNQPIITARRPLSYTSWQRTEDYYNEGLLVWLDVDSKLRELTRNQRSLDDFASRFFGVNDGSFEVNTYDFDEVVSTLDGIAAYDWGGLLTQRLEARGAPAPLDGLSRSGWKLVYTDKPTEYGKSVDTSRKGTDFMYSLGLYMGKEDKITDVLWGSPAFTAGLGREMKLIAVNGRAYTSDLLRDAIVKAKADPAPIELIVRNFDRYLTVRIDYHGGLQYPTLERIPDTQDRLGSLLKPRS